MKYKISLPSDNEGYTELSCQYCRGHFKIRNDKFIERDYSNIYCPICGLTNSINKFYKQEVYDKALEIAKEELYNIIKENLFKGVKSTKYFKITKTNLDVNENKVLSDGNYSMIITNLKCCNSHIKIRKLDKFIGGYCPYCGGTTSEQKRINKNF